MKWLFIILLTVLCACQNKAGNPQLPAIPAAHKSGDTGIHTITPKHDSATLELWHSDTGYFKTYVQLEVTSLAKAAPQHLQAFLDQNIRRNGIQLLNRATMWHSCRVSPDNRFRSDTLRLGAITITQKVDKKHEKLLSLRINGHAITQIYRQGEAMEDLLDYDNTSFRHIRFKGKEYYYFTARLLDCFGASACNRLYHLIYSVKEKRLNYFYTYRTESLALFGDINGDNRLDFMDFVNDGMSTTVPYNPASVTIQLYSDNGQGRFVRQTDARGRPWQIEGHCGHFPKAGDSMLVQKVHWPAPLH